MAFLSVGILPDAKRKELLEGIAELISAADEMIEGAPKDRGGRERNWRIQGFIKELSRLYTEVSGRKAGISKDPLTGEPGGPFFRFVKACIQTYAPHRMKTDEALAKTIQRVLRIKKWQPIIAFQWT